jgi:hypothetical protein
MREITRETFRDDKDPEGNWREGIAKAQAELTRKIVMARAKRQFEKGTFKVQVKRMSPHVYAVILWEK